MKIKYFSAFCVLAALLCACSLPNGTDSTDKPDINQPGTNGPQRNFWAIDTNTNNYYQLTAELLAEGNNCKVWVEKGSNLNTSVAGIVARAYDNEIYPGMMETFGYRANISFEGEIVARNTMEMADWMGDGDGKLTILLLDIKDNYKSGVNDSYVDGYFSYNDLQHTDYSNKCDMIYIDAYPGIPGSQNSNKSLAHEMQHLMNFVMSFIFRNNGKTVYLMDTWIDEGLSTCAEWVYGKEHPRDRWMWYNADMSGLIQKGNNFFVWGSYTSENPYAILDDYSTTYLFFQWLRLQSGSIRIFFDVITSPNFSYAAVTEAANLAIGGKGYGDWGTLLKTWLAANYLNAPSGPYGYMNESTLKQVKAKALPQGTRSVALYPGEGVFSIAEAGFSLPTPGANIKYASLTDNPPSLNDTASYPSGALLTYNANNNYRAGPENGTTTGIAANYSDSDINLRQGNPFSGPENGTTTGIAANYSDSDISLRQGNPFSGPFAIGIGDLAGRNSSLAPFNEKTVDFD